MSDAKERISTQKNAEKNTKRYVIIITTNHIETAQYEFLDKELQLFTIRNYPLLDKVSLNEHKEGQL